MEVDRFLWFSKKKENEGFMTNAKNLKTQVESSINSVGDYNDMLSQADKRSRIPHSLPLIQGFREVVGECGLKEINMIGYPYTWERSRETLSCVEEKLD